MPASAAAWTDAERGALTDEELDEAIQLEAELEGRTTLVDFIKEVSPTRPPPRHFAPVIRLLERARRERLRVCISMPPRHGKTTLFQHAFAWWMRDVNAADTHAYLSYNEGQGLSKSTKIREMAKSCGVALSADFGGKAEWRTPAGGGLLAGGVGSKLTGQGVSGLLVVDDPFKDRKSADSPVNREAVWEWFNEVAFTRQEGSSIFVIHTRWHEDDLIGRLAKMDGWIVVNLPALAASNDNGRDELGREVGEALWPSRYDGVELGKIRKQIGEFSFAALYQGQPRPRGARVFGEAHYYTKEDFEALRGGFRIFIGADPAATDDTTGDYSSIVALAVVGANDETTAYVLEVYRQQVTVPQFAADLLAFQKRHGNAPIHVEAVGGFKAVPQTLRRIHRALRVRSIPATEGDKFTRAQAVAAAWNTARVLVPVGEVDGADVPWLGEFLDELHLFTGVKDANDDQVDALAHAWNSIGAKWTARGARTGGARRM
jgi:predicted phage terminase large subunit-like protein